MNHTPNETKPEKRRRSGLLIWGGLLIGMLFIASTVFDSVGMNNYTVSYSKFLKLVESGSGVSAEVGDTEIHFTLDADADISTV